MQGALKKLFIKIVYKQQKFVKTETQKKKRESGPSFRIICHQFLFL